MAKNLAKPAVQVRWITRTGRAGESTTMRPFDPALTYRSAKLHVEILGQLAGATFS
jgi:hypothetical protein